MEKWIFGVQKRRIIAAICAVTLMLSSVSICNAWDQTEQKTSVLKKTWNACVKNPLFFLKRHQNVRRLLTLLAMGGIGHDCYQSYQGGAMKKTWMGIAGLASLPILLYAATMDPFVPHNTITITNTLNNGKFSVSTARGLRQKGLQCGYYALYHAWCMLRGTPPKQSEFDTSMNPYINEYGENIDQTPMSYFIWSKKELYKALDQDCTFSSHNTLSMTKSMCVNQIKAFNKGKPHYFVLHLPGHWIAVKMEYTNKKKKEVAFTVVDSSGGSSPQRYVDVLNKLYDLFVV